MAKKKSKGGVKLLPTIYIQKKIKNYELRFDFDKRFLAFLKSLPKGHMATRVDKKYVNGKEVDDWVRVIKPIQVGNIITFLRDNGYKFELQNVPKEEVQRLIQDYRGRREKINRILKERVDGFNIGDEKYDYITHPNGHDLHLYQKQGVKFLELTDGKAIIGDQPGVGKTLQALAYAAKHNLKTLVICPASLKLMWRKEIETWTDHKGHVFKFQPTKRSSIKNHPKKDCLFHITNFESVSSFIKLEYKHKCQGRKLDPATKKWSNCGEEIIDIQKSYKVCPSCKGKNTFKKPRVSGLVYIESKKGELINPDDYDLLVIDEAHRIKERTTEWTKIITKSMKDIPRKVLMSGTIIKNRPAELFVPLNFLDPETWNSYHDFGVRYSAAFEDTFGWKYDGASNLEELFERMSPFFLRRRKKDVLSQLPDKTFTEIPLVMTAKQEKEYYALEEAMVEIINEHGETDERKQTFIEKIHKIKAYSELLKLKECKELVDDIIDSNDKIVIFFNYLETGRQLKEMFGDNCVIHDGTMSSEAKHEAVESFQNKKNINVFAGTIDSAGVGITLTAANKLIFIGQAWSHADMEQAEDRIHRATTDHDNVQIITYIVQGTVDEAIQEMLRQKAQIASKVQDNEDYNIRSLVVDKENIMSVLKNYLSR